MKTNLDVGVTLNRAQLKNIKGGLGGDDCTLEYAYDCSEARPCCTGLCMDNATNTGTICMPAP